jgi:transcription antitermination factor NusG
MNEEKQWHVVYTRPQSERRVASLLMKKKIDAYCPLRKVEQQWALVKKVIFEPLFTSYIFVHNSEKEYMAIRQTEGVINFAYWRGRPAVIRPEELTAIKNYLTDSYRLTVEKIPVDVNDIVHVTNCPLVQSEGGGLAVREKAIRISLPSLGYALVAAPKMNVEVVKTARGFRFTIKDI